MLLTFAETTAETIMIIAKTDIKGITVIPFVTVLGITSSLLTLK